MVPAYERGVNPDFTVVLPDLITAYMLRDLPSVVYARTVSVFAA